MSAHSDYLAAKNAVNTAITTVRGLQTASGSPVDATHALEVQTLAEANTALEAAAAALVAPGDSNRTYDKLLELNV